MTDDLHDQTDQAPAALRSSALLGGTARACAQARRHGRVPDARPGLDPLRGARLPGLQGRDGEALPDCKVIYQNANADVAQQQQQFNSVISQGAKVIVLDPVDSTAAASLVKLAQSQGVKVIAYDRPIPDKPADFYVSFDNEGIGKAIADCLRRASEGRGRADRQGRRAADQRLADRRGRRPDQEGRPRGLDASGYKTLAEFDTPDWAPPKAQEWASGQITRFGDRDPRRRRGQRRHRRRRHRGLQGGRRRSGAAGDRQRRDDRGAAADHRRRPVQHHLQAERDRRRGRGQRRGQAPERRDAGGRRRRSTTRRPSSSCRRW